MKKFLLLSVSVSVLGLCPFVASAQQEGIPMRGDYQQVDFEETGRLIEMSLLAEEIEEAGFELDVEEGFDEEWEEEFWVGSDEDEIEFAFVDPDDVILMDMDEAPAADELLDEWADPATLLEEAEELLVDGDEMDTDSEDFGDEFWDEDANDELEAMLQYEAELFGEEETEDLRESSWNDIYEEWEFESLEEEYESEDLDVLEALYFKG